MTQQLELHRPSPYATVGTDVSGSANAHQALVDGGLNWTVEKAPIYGVATEMTADGVGDTHVALPNRVMTVKRMPDGSIGGGLGTVGKDYQIIQNMEIAQFLQNIADISGAEFRNAGSYYGDARLFVQMELPEHVMVAGHDPVNLSLAAFSAHDGTSSLTIVPTATRVFCNNQLPGLRQGALAKIVIPHKSGALANIETARQALGISFKVTTEFKQVADWLYEQPFSTAEFIGLVDEVYKPTVSKKTSLENVSVITRREALKGLFTTADTQESGRFTKWGAYNAIAEYADWFAPVSRPDAEGADARRAARIVSGAADFPKVRAMALLTN